MTSTELGSQVTGISNQANRKCQQMHKKANSQHAHSSAFVDLWHKVVWFIHLIMLNVTSVSMSETGSIKELSVKVPEMCIRRLGRHYALTFSFRVNHCWSGFVSNEQFSKCFLVVDLIISVALSKWRGTQSDYVYLYFLITYINRFSQ